MTMPNDILLLWLVEHANRIRSDERRARAAAKNMVRKDTTYARAIATLGETHAQAAKLYEKAADDERARLGLTLRCTCERDPTTLLIVLSESCWPHGSGPIRFAEEKAARMTFEARRARGFVLRRDEDALRATKEGRSAFPWLVVPGRDRGWDYAVLIEGGTRDG